MAKYTYIDTQVHGYIGAWIQVDRQMDKRDGNKQKRRLECGRTDTTHF